MVRNFPRNPPKGGYDRKKLFLIAPLRLKCYELLSFDNLRMSENYTFEKLGNGRAAQKKSFQFDNIFFKTIIVLSKKWGGAARPHESVP